MGVKVTNNASTQFAASITATATVFSVTSGTGALFPALGPSDWCWLTLTDGLSSREVVKCTAISGDSFTIIRGQDGTTAKAWAAGQTVELRPTAALFNDKLSASDATLTYLPLTGGTLTGALTVNAAASVSGNVSVGGNLSVTGTTTLTSRPTWAGYTPWDSNNLVNVSQLANNQLYARGDAAYLFHWSGQSGQPPWLWGGSDGTNMYVYNPSNFSVNYATSAGNANYATSAGSVGGVSNPATNGARVQRDSGIVETGALAINGIVDLSAPYMAMGLRMDSGGSVYVRGTLLRNQ